MAFVRYGHAFVRSVRAGSGSLGESPPGRESVCHCATAPASLRESAAGGKEGFVVPHFTPPYEVGHELALLRSRCGATGLPAPPLRRGRVVLYADRLTVAGWVGLRRHRWDVLLLDIAAARVVEDGLRLELVDGPALTLTLDEAAEWAARIAEYRACLGPPK